MWQVTGSNPIPGGRGPGNTARLLVGMFAVGTPIIHAQAVPLARDSSGIRVVLNGVLDRSQAPFRIAETWTLDLGGSRDDPAQEIDPRTALTSGRPLSDGRWVVVGYHSLKLFDQDGGFVRQIGRPDTGPAEFQQIRAVCVTPGDTILAIGLADHRVVVFDSTGSHVATHVHDGNLGLDPCLDDGSLLIRRIPKPGAAPEITDLGDLMAPVERVRWDGSRLASLGSVAMESLDRTFSNAANVVGNVDRVVVGNGSDPEYRVMGVDGKLQQIVRWRAPFLLITQAVRRAAIKQGYPPSGVERQFLPQYLFIVAGEDGSVWVQDYDRTVRPGWGYAVFDRSGTYLGRVERPSLPTARVVWVGKGRVLVAWRDTEGTQHLTLHALVRGE